ncbi:hypothetical protein LguiB_025010 [Lonicera macranthoides]
MIRTSPPMRKGTARWNHLFICFPLVSGGNTLSIHPTKSPQNFSITNTNSFIFSITYLNTFSTLSISLSLSLIFFFFLEHGPNA